MEKTLKSYLIGFFISLCLTLGAFFLILEKPFSLPILYILVIFMGLLQAVTQLILFLGLGKEGKPRFNLLLFLFMLLVLLILVLGSLWIMYSLNQRVMEGM